jgi:hypothetical protein
LYGVNKLPKYKNFSGKMLTLATLGVAVRLVAGAGGLAAVRFDVKVHTGENEYGFGHKFFVDSVVSALANPIVLRVGDTYEFLQAYPNNLGYMIRFSTSQDVVDNAKNEWLVQQLRDYYPEMDEDSAGGLLQGYLQYQSTKTADATAISKSATRAVIAAGGKGMVQKTYCTEQIISTTEYEHVYNETANTTETTSWIKNTTHETCTGGEQISASNVQKKILELTKYSPFGREDITSGGITEFTNRVLHIGTPGQAGAKTQLIPDESYPDTLYMYCEGVPGMGGRITISRVNSAATTSADANVQAALNSAVSLVGTGSGYVSPTWQQVTDFTKVWMSENGRVYYDSDMSSLGKSYGQTIRWKGSAVVLGLLLPGAATDSATGAGTVNGGNWAGSKYDAQKQTLTLFNHDENRWWAMRLQCKMNLPCEYRFLNPNASGKNFASKGPMYRDFETAFVSATGELPPADAVEGNMR